MTYINFDHNASTTVCDVAKEAFLEALPLSNPMSVHKSGKKASFLLQKSREESLIALNAPKDFKVIFSSSCTESNNIIVLNPFFDEVITSSIEHPSVLEPARRRSKSKIIQVNSDGELDLSELKTSLDEAENDSKILVSIIAAHNETGVVQDIRAISEIVHSRQNAFLHCDITQLIGKEFFDLTELGIDIITLSSHKIHSIHGTGLAVYSPKVRLLPIYFGGAQENFTRPGTHNLPSIHACSKTLTMVTNRDYVREYQGKTQSLKGEIINAVKANGGVIASENAKKTLTNTVMVAMKNISNSVQLIEFDLSNIMVSNGSACSSGKVNISQTIQAMKFDKSLATNFIRVSLDASNTLIEVEKFIDIWSRLNLKT